MAIGSKIGQAMRKSAQPNAFRKRNANPDPDGVIANQVVSQIAERTSSDFSDYLRQAKQRLQDSAPSAPRGVVNGASMGRASLIGMQQAAVPPLAPFDPASYLGRTQMPPGLDQLFAEGRAPAGLMGRELTPMMPNAPQKTFPAYEDGSFNMGRPSPMMPSPYPTGAPANPFDIPPVPTLNPMQPPQMIDPQLERILRMLGMI